MQYRILSTVIINGQPQHHVIEPRGHSQHTSGSMDNNLLLTGFYTDQTEMLQVLRSSLCVKKEQMFQFISKTVCSIEIRFSLFEKLFYRKGF